MKRVGKNVLCICGHRNEIHHGVHDIYGGHYPSGCSAIMDEGQSCLCWAFEMDNLAYLEDKAYERNI